MARSSMPRMSSMYLRSATRSSSVRCSDTAEGSCAHSAVLVAIGLFVFPCGRGPGGIAGRGMSERVWWTRLRWRLRGATMWPAFVPLVALDALLLHELPIAGDTAPE